MYGKPKTALEQFAELEVSITGDSVTIIMSDSYINQHSCNLGGTV
jgi:hypothetical protein